MVDLKTYLESRRESVDRALETFLPPENAQPEQLHAAMRYAVLSGGKRLRPVLCLASAEALGGSPDAAMAPAAALEMIHAYSLIHDDLPAMDDDDLRRGRPTCHIAFGEAVAILAGDALLTLAFEVLAAHPAPEPYGAAGLVLELAQASGHAGMVAGQAKDILSEGKAIDRDALDFIHRHKTAALITAALRMGAMAVAATREQLERMTQYGRCIGLAFQIVDDVLNETSDEATLGKPVRSDRERGKATYPALYGLDAARAKAGELISRAEELVAGWGDAGEPLAALARYVAERID